MGPPRFRDFLAIFARGADVGMGLPEDHGVRTALVAHRLALLANASPRAVRDAVFASLLRYSGCTADSDLSAHVLGDEIAVRGAMYGKAHFSDPRELLAFVWDLSGKARGLGARLTRFAQTISRMPGLMQSAAAHCEVNDILAGRLGLDDRCRETLRQTFEAWNGSGLPKKLRGAAIALAARVAIVADEVEPAHRLGGAPAIAAIARRRSGRAFDPVLAQLVVQNADAIAELLAVRSPSALLASLELEDEPIADVPFADAVCEALADFADLKCDHTRGHSTAVASLSVAAAALLRVPSDERALLRRAALLHDVGRVGVSFAIWHKPGPLGDVEWERVRMHTLFTERILGGSVLVREAELAALAHERLDGAGYHRRLPPNALTTAARVLAAADVFQALCSARPHRDALSPARAADVLREEVRSARLGGDAAEAVIAAAGERPKPASSAPRGLTEREVEILRLITRGLTNKQIAQVLQIAPKTAGNHVQNVLGKLGVSTRAGAAMFAMRSGLVS